MSLKTALPGATAGPRPNNSVNPSLLISLLTLGLAKIVFISEPKIRVLFSTV
jgi:hypothetical protein